MPRKNIIKQYGEEQFYHVYSRGVNKQAVFLHDNDYVKFLGILKRYLSPDKYLGSNRRLLPTYYGRIELLAYCLMRNHIHLLIYMHDEKAMTELMRSVMISYSMYFNKKYGRVGPLFQSTYKATIIDKQNYLDHISRYIHLNPKDWLSYKYSSLGYYLENNSPPWLSISPVLELFENSSKTYLEFLRDHEQHKQMLEEIKWELANELTDEP